MPISKEEFQTIDESRPVTDLENDTAALFTARRMSHLRELRAALESHGVDVAEFLREAQLSS